MVSLRVNGRPVDAAEGISVAVLLDRLGFGERREGLAIALNEEVLPRGAWPATVLSAGDRVEVVEAVQGGSDAAVVQSAREDSERGDALRIGPLALDSRLILGSSGYPSQQHLLDALAASGTRLVTVAMRRLETRAPGRESLLPLLRERGYQVLPNTAGCRTVRDAVLTAQLARESLGTPLVKLEVIGDERTLYPDSPALLEAARELTRQEFVVLPYCTDDPVLCLRLEELGCPCVMPLAAPIGSGLGIRNPHNLAMIRDTVRVPVIVDAGVGTASDVAIAMELGMDGVLLNTAIAGARDPVRMARAMRLAVVAGRLAWQAGRIPRKAYAQASSPVEGLIETRFGRAFDASFPKSGGSERAGG